MAFTGWLLQTCLWFDHGFGNQLRSDISPKDSTYLLLVDSEKRPLIYLLLIYTFGCINF